MGTFQREMDFRLRAVCAFICLYECDVLSLAVQKPTLVSTAIAPIDSRQEYIDPGEV